MSAKVLIIGGTGFIGYHAVQKFYSAGYQVSVLAHIALPKGVHFPPGVTMQIGNVLKMPESDLLALLSKQDALVFAAGADDRTLQHKPAEPYFQRNNVEASQRVFGLARMAGVRRGVLIGSYFAYFHRIWPELRLAEVHPYIRSRVQQEEQALAASFPTLELVILELPYIFGRMPGRVSMWKPLVDYLRSPWPLFYPAGGSSMIAVEAVAEAIVGAVERGASGERYQVGDENLSWGEMLERLGRAAGRHKEVYTLPKWSVKAALSVVKLHRDLKGVEGGLRLPALAELQTRFAYLDAAPAQFALGYQRGGLEQAFADTVAACEV